MGYLKTALTTGFLIFLLLIGVKPALAVNYTVVFETSPPAGYSACTAPGGCVDIGTCWNSEAPGVTDCGQSCIIDGVPRGNAWSKYTYSGCVETREDPITGESSSCASWYTESPEAVCSTADKCTSTNSNPYLNAGSCSCTTGNLYKTCCSNGSPSYVIDDPRSGTSDSCVQLSVDTTNPPYEGVCPAGSHSEFCGFGGYPACGQAACGPLPATPTCTDGIQNGNETGIDCGGSCPNACSAPPPAALVDSPELLIIK